MALTRGLARHLAREFLAGRPVPVFRRRDDNRAIDRHETRILTARTRRDTRYRSTGTYDEKVLDS